MSDLTQVLLLTAAGVGLLLGLGWVAARLYPSKPKEVGGVAAFLVDEVGNASSPFILDGPPLPPAVESDMKMLFDIIRETGASDVFAIRRGEHLVMFVNENAARCSCGWRTIALTEDLDSIVEDHFATAGGTS